MKISIDEIYSNLLLTATSHRYDFCRLVKEADEEIEEHIAELKSQKPYLPEGYEGLLFVELVARKMGSSLGEVYSLSSDRKEEILHNLINRLDSEDSEEAWPEGYDLEKDGVSEFKWSFRILAVSEESEILGFLNQKYSGAIGDCFAYYSLTFRKELRDADKKEYTYYIFLSADDGFSDKHMANNQKVWSGSSGFLADYINSTIEEYEEEEKWELEAEEDEEDEDEDYTGTVHKTVYIPIFNASSDSLSIKTEQPNKPAVIMDELIVSVSNDTRTIPLLDKFEGYGTENNIKYQRIVIKNPKYFYLRPNIRVGFHLVIERGKGHDYIGNITFTEFKKGNDSRLRKFVLSEIDDNIINQYVDKDRFFKFSSPFLLRAQNSSNRTGYGWEWDWSGGHGNYTEGTFYGETSNYFFVGAYISSLENFYYDSSKRSPFWEEELISEPAHLDNIVFYDGKLQARLSKGLIQKYFKVTSDGYLRYIPTSYDEKTSTYYVDSSNKKYQSLFRDKTI